MKNTILLTTLAISIVAGSTLMAGNEHARGGPRHHLNFEEIDTNKDGKLTRDEMAAHREARFNTTDTNKDGLINADELRARIESNLAKKVDRRVAHVMEHRDTNGDGMLTKDEMKPDDPGRMIKRVDTDGDGTISKAEFDAMKDKRRKGHKQSDQG